MHSNRVRRGLPLDAPFRFKSDTSYRAAPRAKRDDTVPVALYVISNSVNAKRYIGQTIHPLAIRMSQHVSTATRPSRSSILHAAIRKHGPEVFTIRLLERVDTKAEADDLERDWIRVTGSNDRATGYNVARGGEGPMAGLTHTAESRAKMSAARKGKPKSAEHRANMSAALQGRQKSPESVAKSAAAKRGSLHTAESKAKISAGLLRAWSSGRRAP